MLQNLKFLLYQISFKNVCTTEIGEKMEKKLFNKNKITGGSLADPVEVELEFFYLKPAALVLYH